VTILPKQLMLLQHKSLALQVEAPDLMKHVSRNMIVLAITFGVNQTACFIHLVLLAW